MPAPGAASDPLAAAAVEPIRSGMVIGLGTGRAAARAIRALAARARAEKLELTCVSTSIASSQLAESLGLRVAPMEGEAGVARIDYLFDGADEVDPRLRMIKGRGGAMTREKIAARAAARRVYLIDESKLVGRLGERAPLPVEVLPFGLASVRERLRAAGLDGPIRLLNGSPARTDNGNAILDVAVPPGADPAALDRLLNDVPGVVGHGLFLAEADEVLVESPSGAVRRLTRDPAHQRA